MKIRLALILGLTVLLQGCIPVPTRNTKVEYFYLPTSAAPLHSYSNGAALHRYFDCYRSLEGDRESCDANYLALEHGNNPDWQALALARERANIRLSKGVPAFKPVLSAYSGTTRRVVGRWEEPEPAYISDSSVPYVAFIDYDAAKNEELDHAKRRGEIDSLDIRVDEAWRGEPQCLSKPTMLPMLVVQDESSIWIFAETAPGCQWSTADLRVPADMMTFDHPERFAEVLHKPMNLFYLSKPDAHRLRLVSSDPWRLKHLPATVIAPDLVPIPTGKVFKLEYNEFHDPLDALPAANFQCNYSKIQLVQWVIGWVDTYPTLDGCRSIPARRQHKN